MITSFICQVPSECHWSLLFNHLSLIFALNIFYPSTYLFVLVLPLNKPTECSIISQNMILNLIFFYNLTRNPVADFVLRLTLHCLIQLHWIDMAKLWIRDYMECFHTVPDANKHVWFLVDIWWISFKYD